jgi:UDP-N-acetylmuramate dehydrogenase
MEFFTNNYISKKKLKQNNTPYDYRDIYIIGNASNILISDNGFDGMIIKLEGEFQAISIVNKETLEQNFEIQNTLTKGINLDSQKIQIIEQEYYLKSGAAALSSSVAKFTKNHSIEGFEFLNTIPGAIGGNIFMNAGCYGGEISHVISQIECINKTTTAPPYIIERSSLNFKERQSNLGRDNIILYGFFNIKIGNKLDISNKMQQMQQNRLQTQPVAVKTCGSTFVNPNGHKAWKLIDEVGLRGFTIGGAKFSEKHSNFIINFNNAKSKDIEDLINLAKAKIKDKTEIEMRTEIEILE